MMHNMDYVFSGNYEMACITQFSFVLSTKGHSCQRHDSLPH